MKKTRKEKVSTIYFFKIGENVNIEYMYTYILYDIG